MSPKIGLFRFLQRYKLLLIKWYNEVNIFLHSFTVVFLNFLGFFEHALKKTVFGILLKTLCLLLCFHQSLGPSIKQSTNYNTPWRVTGYFQENQVGVCVPLLKNLTLFKTKICNFPYSIWYLIQYKITLLQTCLIVQNNVKGIVEG